MQIRRQQMWVAGMLLAVALLPVGRAQAQVRTVIVRPPTLTNIRLQTSVTVPNGGTAFVGGYRSLSESRSSYGVPILGRTPYLSRGFHNVGYGRSTMSGSVTVRGRIIDLRDEEYRQTGFRSP